MAPVSSPEADHIREKARRDLLNLLEGVRGKKNLVISKALAGPINLVVKFSTLQEYGVDKLFLLENGNTDSSQRNVVYVVHGERASQIQAAAEQIKALQRNGTGEHEFSIFWVPRRTLVSNKILEDEGILGDANISEFPLFFLPLETDVLSLELEDSFGDLYLRNDPTSIYLASKALMLIQQRHGLFPRIVGKGDNARRLAQLLQRGRKELDVEEGYSALVVIDRDVDFATVLLTQLTYEGLIDETVGIYQNQAEVDATIVGSAPPPQQSQSASVKARPPQAAKGPKRKVQLDASDNLFSQLRDTNFAIVGGLLNKVARRLESDYEARHGARTTNELRDFVNRLPGYQAEHQSLRTHTNLAEDIMKFTRTDTFRRVLEVQQNLAAGSDPSYQHDTIEELIARDVPLNTVLRLLCLVSCIAGGIRQRELDLFKRHILHAYGYQHLLTLDALEKMELLQPRSSATTLLLPGAGATPGAGTKTNYNNLRKHLRLIVDEVNEQNPNDIAYVYSGYAPLSIRLVQCLLQKQYIMALSKSPGPPPPLFTSSGPPTTSWAGFEDVVKSVKGATFSIIQKGPDDKAVKARTALTGSGGMKMIYVMFLGGITFTEIAALRFIGRQLEENEKRKLVICTTSIISGDKMMDVAVEKGSFGKK
ncbi:putative vacuolar sorting protein [Phaeomoniella chlamydospora]|uniref:Putative vacuolar sorting protein n=1 Tax=Phaeomoniella chlamydospora TaxID=158046 RepID=A0A0G2ERZ0_PHACM|nr:putative vacuolar sorting protein [Phaeomoniella chlamydospora]